LLLHRQALVCPGGALLNVSITEAKNIDSVLIQEVECWGSLTNVTAHSPSGVLYTTDYDVRNGDERFLWDFGVEAVGAYFQATCLDLVCPLDDLVALDDGKKLEVLQQIYPNDDDLVDYYMSLKSDADRYNFDPLGFGSAAQSPSSPVSSPVASPTAEPKVCRDGSR
jgi:hypothetical protein